jgi:hypothetical protein
MILPPLVFPALGYHSCSIDSIGQALLRRYDIQDKDTQDIGLFSHTQHKETIIQRHYAECRYAECHGLFIVMQSVMLLNIIMLNVVAPRAQCCKTLHVRNLRLFVISWSICPWQAFPTLSNVCE